MAVNKYICCLLLAAVGLFTGVASASPEIQSWSTSNGARVYYVYAKELPMVDIRVVFDAGSARDGKQPGLSKLTNGLLTEGAGKLTADDIAERMEGVGARYGNSSLRDMAILSMRSLTDEKLLTTALDTFELLISSPSFPEKAYERERQRLLIGIKQEKQSPRTVASKAFYRKVFQGHPYASPINGTEESVAAIKRQDLIDFYNRYYVAKNTLIAIVGAVDKKQARAIADKLLSKLPAGEVAPAIDKVRQLQAPVVERISHPSKQSHIYVGQPGMRRGDKDYFPLYVGNHALGGSGLVSLLSEEIREKRGLSYSVYSYFSPMREDGPFIVGLQTKNEQAREALQVLKDTLTSYIEKGITEKQLLDSKKNIIGGFPLRIDSNSKITEYIAMIGFYKLPLDYLDKFNARVDAVTVKDIRDAFKRRIHADKMVTVIVGGKPQVTEPAGIPDKVKQPAAR